MSTKTSIKRVALIAVSALGFGLMSAVPSSAVDGTGTATLAGPVRVSFTDGVRDTVSAQAFTFKNIAAQMADDTTTSLTMEVTQAPTTAAVVQINLGGSQNTSDSLGAAATAATTGVNVLAAAIDSAGTGSGTIAISSNAASGTYKGTFTLGDGTDNIVVSWSFTTTGKVASIGTDADKYEMPAVAESKGANADPDETDDQFVVSKVITVTLKDSTGATTQPATGDTISYEITSATNITFAATASATATGTLSNANLVDGTESITVGSQTATADSETVTFTPLGVMPAQGVAAKSVTVTTAGFAAETSVDTVLSSPTSTSVVAAGAASGSASSYIVDPSNVIYVFKATGYQPGSAYRIGVRWTDVNGAAVGVANVKDDTSNATAASLTSGAIKYLYGIAPATGTVTVTVTSTANNNNLDTIEVNAENGNATFNDAADALVTNTVAAYAVSTSTPVSTSLQVAGTPINVTGKVTDTYGNPVPGATIGLAGVVTSTVATDANLTATATTAADGTWSASLTPTAATTRVVVTASATKTGIASISSAAAITINFNASGSPSTMTWSALGDEDTATALSPVTTYPASLVVFAGSVGGNTTELYTIANAATDPTDGELDATDHCVAITATTDPGAQVTFTGSAGVKFTTTSCGTAQTLASLKDTVTVASGTAAYAVATKVGKNTVTMTSGTVSKTATFYAFNVRTALTAGDAVRNLAVDKTSLELNGGEYAFITISATDAFGNVVKNAKASASVLVKATGSALLDGPALSRTYTTTDADGNIVVGVVAGQTAGTATITIEGSGAQLGAAAGSATSTTAGTNGLTASTNKLTVKVTVTGNAQDATEAAFEATEAANQAYEAAVVATETAEAAVAAAEDAKAAADAATAAVEALATSVSTMMAELKAQVAKLAKTVAKILKRV